MNTMISKKQYAAPSLNIIYIETEGMLAASNNAVMISDSVTEDDARMSGSRDEGWNHTWE
ncbi:MAG: hypothetical protein II200_05795 [Bacteroidaceae bacterium]|nr:hypothetical protein [Bacteroidaceae bacterium]